MITICITIILPSLFFLVQFPFNAETYFPSSGATSGWTVSLYISFISIPLKWNKENCVFCYHLRFSYFSYENTIASSAFTCIECTISVSFPLCHFSFPNATATHASLHLCCQKKNILYLYENSKNAISAVYRMALAVDKWWLNGLLLRHSEVKPDIFGVEHKFIDC